MTTQVLAKLLHQFSRREAGDRKEAWALAQRVAGYLRWPKVWPDEELAFNMVAQNRVGVARFRCTRSGNLKNHAMISIEKGALPANVWRDLVALGKGKIVDAGSTWNLRTVTRQKKRK